MPGRFIASARFQVPELPAAFVARPELVERLERAPEPLTLVTGVPGAGKTAVVSSWIAGRPQDTAWLSCDPTDADPVRFWAALASAVQRVVPDAGLDALERLDETGSETADAVGSLASDCGASPGLAIVIDDFHHSGSTPAAMATFIRALPPGARLVLTSRRDPSFGIGRLRVQGRLLEIRDEDLQFSAVEARELLVRMGIEVSDVELERLYALTEGWAAGLQLAALSLAHRRAPGDFLRSIAETDRGVADFLVNEVIDVQPPEVEDFLMQTSVLDSFDGALCDAVTGRPGSSELLRHLHEAHHFVIALDRRAGWYRYHHLFASFLRGRLQAQAPARLRGAHAAASEAFAARGEIMSAVDHAMSADDLEAAFRLVRQMAAAQLDLDGRQGGVDTVRAWLRRHAPRYLEHEPRLVVECCLLLAAVGAPDDIAIWLERVERSAPAALEPGVAALLAAVWALHLLHHGDPAEALQRIEKARGILGDEVGGEFWVAQWPIVACQAHLWLDDPTAARLAAEAARPSSAQSPVLDTVRLPGLLAWAALVDGELAEAERQAGLALEAAEALRLGEPNLGWTWPRLALAGVARERDELDEAELLLAAATAEASAAHRPPTTLLCVLERARLSMARGAPDEAGATLETARRVMPGATRAVTDHIDRIRARIAIDAADARAEELVAGLLPTPSRDLLNARLRLTVGDAHAASELLDAVSDQLSGRRLRIEHGLLRARALAKSDRAGALRQLDDALRLAAPVSLVRAVVDEGPAVYPLLQALPTDIHLDLYMARVLDAVHRRPASAGRGSPRQMVEPLSDRQREALRYLASRLTYGEIASELYISVNTLKSHVKAVYRKLGVSTRAEAVHAARQAGIL